MAGVREEQKFNDEMEKFNNNNFPEYVKQRRKEIKEEAKALTQKTFYNSEFDKEIKLYNSGIKEWINQPHKHYVKKNELLLDIENVIKNAKYKGDSTYKGYSSHIFETTINGDKTWIIATEINGRGVAIYSISDSIKVLEGIKKVI